MSVGNKDLDNLFDTVSLGAPERSVGFVLWRVMHRYQREIDQALAPCDLTHLQFTTLAMAAWLCREDSSITQADLARQAEMHPMQVSLMLKALEAKGMIDRQSSVADSRTKLVSLTPIGLAALRGAFPAAISVQQRMFGSDGNTGDDLLQQLLAIEMRHAG